MIIVTTIGRREVHGILMQQSKIKEQEGKGARQVFT